jgi:hypothetical protein
MSKAQRDRATTGRREVLALEQLARAMRRRTTDAANRAGQDHWQGQLADELRVTGALRRYVLTGERLVRNVSIGVRARVGELVEEPWYRTGDARDALAPTYAARFLLNQFYAAGLIEEVPKEPWLPMRITPEGEVALRLICEQDPLPGVDNPA